MECPKCKSLNLRKRGFRSGKQRYQCLDCKASFTEGVEYHPAKTYAPLTGIECPKCHSTSIRRDGKLEDGTPRYQCKECNLNFSPKTDLRGKVEWKCPYCGGELIRAGHNKKGRSSYTCKECKKSCTSDETGKPIKRDEVFKLSNKEVKCPYCGSLNLNKAGYTKYGNQKYLCKDCWSIFNECTPERKNLKELIASILKGANIRKLAQGSGYSYEYLRKVVVPYYKKEKVTDDQKRAIIRYGYYLRVPVDYMAEYIKCSEHKCNEILRKFKKKVMSTTHDANQ